MGGASNSRILYSIRRIVFLEATTFSKRLAKTPRLLRTRDFPYGILYCEICICLPHIDLELPQIHFQGLLIDISYIYFVGVFSEICFLRAFISTCLLRQHHILLTMDYMRSSPTPCPRICGITLYCCRLLCQQKAQLQPNFLR